MRNFWSDKEIKVLVEKFPHTTNDELVELFSGRTFNSINVKAKRLKLKRNFEIKIRNRSEAHIGEKNGMWGKNANRNPLSTEQKKHLSIIRKKMYLEGKCDVSGEKNGMWGKIPHNKGKKMSPEFGKKVSEGIRKYWDSLPEEDLIRRKNELRESWVKILVKYRKITTLPEKIFEELLIKNKIVYVKEKRIGYYVCDFIINDNIVFEIQGDYWHANPKKYKIDNLDRIQRKNVNRDKNKYIYLTNRSFKVLYLWEDELKNNITYCEKLLKENII